MIITGYRINTTTLKKIENKLDEVRNKLNKYTDELYHEKLGEEIAFLCDCIALNILNRNEGDSIFDSAVANVNQMIRTAGMTGVPTDYNMQVYAYIMNYDGYTYLKVICPNSRLINAFKSLESFSLSESECQDLSNPKTAIWQTLHGLYENREPISVNLTQEIKADPKKLIYPSVYERSQVCARHNLENRLLNQIAGGDQIAPYRMMSFLDTVIQMLDKSDIKAELQKKTQELAYILPDLNNDDSFIFGPDITQSAEDKQ